MKVIDLLNKIANGEAPENIKYNDTNYYLYDNYSYLRNDKSRFFDSIYFKELNDEVEIIEEDKKIEKLDIKHVYYSDYTEALCEKVDEIIDYINKENK